MTDEADLPKGEVDAPISLATFDDLSVAEGTGTTLAGPGIGGKAKWVQTVELERDGQPWCTWEDAEAMLVANARAAMRGRGGLKPKGYKVTRDEAAGTLALELV